MIIYKDIEAFALDNKYTAWYLEIVNNPDQSDYTENHHWYPDCFGGTETVALSARQHYIAHWLLTKMARDKNAYVRMLRAFSMMHRAGRGDKRYVNSRAFAQLRKDMKVVGSAVGLSNLGKPKTIEHRKKMSAAMKGKLSGKRFINKDGANKRVSPEELQEWLDDGWALGRDLSNKGRVWMHKGKDLKFVWKQEVSKYLAEGYAMGHNNLCGNASLAS